MNIELTPRNYQPTRRVRDSVEERAEKFSKYAQELQQVRVTLTGEKLDHICDIHLHAYGKDFHANASDDDMLVAVDKASASMEKQLRRHKDKRSGHRHSDEMGPTTASQLESSLVSHDVGDEEE